MSRYTDLRAEILIRLGGRCACCDITNFRLLDIDHVFADGAEERKQYRGLAYLKHILADIDSGRYQALCPLHHRIKRLENLEDGRRVDLAAIDSLEMLARDYDPEDP